MFRNASRSLAILLAVLATTLPAQVPTLIKDTYPGPGSGMAGPGGFSLTPGPGGLAFFHADDGVSGGELWVSDGTSAGTFMVRDIYPGPNSSLAGFAVPTGEEASFVCLGDSVVFSADDGVTGAELWISDGTHAGTFLVKDIYPGVGGSLPGGFVVMSNHVYFVATDPASGRELWKTDGTAQGTQLVYDIWPGSSSVPDQLTVLRDRVYFCAASQGEGFELWSSDGTAAGTSMVVELAPSGSHANIEDLTAAGGSLWFAASPLFTLGLWKSDGTATGTTLVRGFPAAGFSTPQKFTALGSDVFFTVSDGTHGEELWKTDGTGVGTSLVKDIRPGSGGSCPLGLIVLEDKLLFDAWDSAGGPGNELWVSDGTLEGTVQLVDIRAGKFGSVPQRLTRVGSRWVYFSAWDGSTGIELWKTDGTIEGTSQVADLHPGAVSSSPWAFVMAGGKLLFSADDGTNGRELWKVFPGATSESFGYPCATPGTLPSLSATDPAWLDTWTITGTGFTPGTAVWLLNSFAAAPTLLGACTLYVDASAWGLFWAQAVTSSTWELSIPLPTIPALLGTSLVLQAVQAPTAGPLGADLTNAVVSTFGG